MSPTPTIRQRYERARASGRPLLGGHRGDPARQPENTLAAFRSALDLGLDMVECDVHLSADGELVVIHDPTVDRTTDGHGSVRSMSSARLRELDAGQGEQLPLLQELIELVRDRAGLVIELKEGDEPYPGFEDLLLGRLRATDMVEQTAIISFHHPWIKRVKAIEPALQCGVLEVTPSGDPVALMRRFDADFYAPHYSAASRDLCDRIHSAGAFVGVWTVDDRAALERVLAAGVDSIFTNRPADLHGQY